MRNPETWAQSRCGRVSPACLATLAITVLCFSASCQAQGQAASGEFADENTEAWKPPANCPVGWGGPSCVVDRIPSCRQAGSGELNQLWKITSCDCIKEWVAHLAPFYVEDVHKPCFNIAPGTPVDHCLDAPDECPIAFLHKDDGSLVDPDTPRGATVLRHLNGQRVPKLAPRHLCEPNAPPPRPPPPPASPPDKAPTPRSPEPCRDEWCLFPNHTIPPGACTGDGFCTRPDAGDGPAKCMCSTSRSGHFCERVGSRCPQCRPSPRGDGSRCLNHCSGRGTCRHHTCICDAGHGGLDCSIAAAPDGSPGGINVHTGEAGGGIEPRIFIAELPDAATTHWVTWRRWNDDGGRPAGIVFLEACLRSRRRVMRPEDAHYLIMPVVGGIFHDRLAAYEYVRRTYGDLLDRVKVVWPPMMNDAGLHGYRHAEKLREEHGDHNIFITAHGCHVNSKWLNIPGNTRPGVDIVVPELAYLLDPFRGRAACDFSPSAHESRPMKLFFSGSTVHEFAGHNARLDLHEALGRLNRSDYLVQTEPERGGGVEQVKPFKEAEFCLALHGKTGGYAVRDFMGMLEGCLPVFGMDNTSWALEELFPPKDYGLVVAQKDFASLPTLLDHLDPAHLRQLRHAATRACQGMMPPKGALYNPIHKRMGGSDVDEPGNFVDSVLTILANRLHKDSVSP